MAKIGKNGKKSVKNHENRKKIAKIGKNSQKNCKNAKKKCENR